MLYKMYKLLFFTALIGCSYQPNNVQVQIDNSFSADKIGLIFDALDNWSVKTDQTFVVGNVDLVDGISSDSEFNTIKFINTNTTEQRIGKNLVVLGRTEYYPKTFAHPEFHIEAVVSIWNDEHDDIFIVSAMHEIGHATNLGHLCSLEEATNGYDNCQVVSIDPVDSIMHPTVEVGWTIDQIDVYRFCELWSCRQ